MHTPKPVLILCLLAFLQYHAHAQNINPDGYYINLTGDTVSGKFINYREYNKSPASIAFQPARASQPMSLTPANCRKLSVAHYDTYISYKGKRLTNETDSHNAQEETPNAYEDVNVFLRELFNDSHYQLYELAASNRNNYYVSSASAPLEELYFRVYIENNSVVESPYFRSQLSFLFKDSLKRGNNLERQLAGTTYNGESLQRLFMTITIGKAKTTKDKYPARVFVGLGASLNSFAVKGDASTAPVELLGTYSTTVSPVVEAGVKLYSQRNFGRPFFTLRLSAYQYKNTMYFPGNSSNYATTSVYKATVLSLPVSYGYQFVHKENLSVSFSLGFSALLLINNVRDGVSNNSTYQGEENNGVSFTYTPFGELEAAIKKKVSFYMDGYLPVSVGSYVAYSPRHTSIVAGLRYFF